VSRCAPVGLASKVDQLIHYRRTGRVFQRTHKHAAATTAVLTTAKNPAVVHVASHGYYASPSDQNPSPTALPPANGLPFAITGLPISRDDAILNSGIVLAGANRAPRTDLAPTSSPRGSQGSPDDGSLTAQEVAQLQLGGTELVVLSACDTASGDQQSGEGLLGLQRALSVAGARSTLLTLWTVETRPPPLSWSATTGQPTGSRLAR
jgi:CHAT domain-containing protein